MSNLRTDAAAVRHEPMGQQTIAGFATARPARQSASGKVIVIGEHAVVYGARAIAAPLSQLHIHISVTPRSSSLSGDGAHNVRLEGKLASQQVRDVVADAFDLLGLPVFPLRVEGASELPVGAGLGSSAALCVAVLRALAQSVGLHLTSERLATLANRLETRFHGTPSGLDTAVVALEQVMIFHKANDGTHWQPLKLAAAPSWRFALVDSGVRASTLAMVQTAAPHFRGVRGRARIKAFDAATAAAAVGLSGGHYEQVVAALRTAHDLLSEIGVITAHLESMITTMKSLGIDAAKATGAGGGGFVLALLPPNQEAERLADLRETFGEAAVFELRL